MKKGIFKKKNAKETVMLVSFASVILVFLVVWAFGGYLKNGWKSFAANNGYTTVSDYQTYLSYVDEYYQGKRVNLKAGTSGVEIDALEAGAPVSKDELTRFFAEKGYDKKLIDSYFDANDDAYNDEYIEKRISALAEMASYQSVSRYEIGEDEVTIIRGKKKLIVDAEKTAALVKEAFDKFEYGDLNASFTEEKPSEPDWEKLKNDAYTAPVDARYTVGSSGLTIFVPESTGRTVNIDQIKKEFETESWTEKSYSYDILQPEITTQNIRQKLFPDVLTSYTSYYYEQDVPRTTNVKLSSAAIDGYVVLPGKRFSFNAIVGERTAEKGYQPATIYTGANTKKELGGGICQVASTIYCATLSENLKQITRNEHSQIVTYVPFGMDATIYWGSSDYVFENDTENPIMVTITCKNGALTVKLLGKSTRTITASFRWDQLEEYPPIEELIPDDTLAPGERKVISEGKTGYYGVLYRTLTIDGVVQPETRIDSSKYVPTVSKIRVGPSLPETAVPETTVPETTVPETTAPPETTVAEPRP